MTIERLNKIQLINADCIDVLRELPDKSFDLAIVDPPYSNAGGEVERIQELKQERLMKQQSEPQLFAAEDLVGNAWDGGGYLF